MDKEYDLGISNQLCHHNVLPYRQAHRPKGQNWCEKWLSKAHRRGLKTRTYAHTCSKGPSKGARVFIVRTVSGRFAR